MNVNNSLYRWTENWLRHLYPFLILGTALLAAGPLGAQVSKEVFLKTEISVKGPYVTLGDLFMNVDDELADESVARAPAPGKRIAFTPRHIASFARVHQLTWRNSGRQARIIVRRDSKIVKTDDILPVLKEALADEGPHPTMDVVFNDPQMQIHVPENAEIDLSVRDLTFNPANGVFNGRVAISSGTDQVRFYPVGGRAYPTRRVPVLSGYAERGTLLEEVGLEWKDVRISRLSQNTITELDDLAGMEARRHLTPGQMIRESDIQKPIMVQKGAALTIHYEAPGLSLSVQGKAMENGSKGDVIRVVNTRSNKSIEARVTGPSTVAAPRSMILTAIR